MGMNYRVPFKNFVVKNVCDKELTEERQYTKYDVTIQSGCALTKERIAALADDTGDNISEKNPSFSEFTALYWVWQNIREEYIGWSHYRRRLDLSEQEMEYYIGQGVDAILAEPHKLLLADGEASIRDQYVNAHTLDAWDTMLEVVKKRDPECYAHIETLSQRTEIFPCCIGIYRYEYFERYCSWLFPILQEVYCIIGEKWDRYQNRYIAFLGERLHSMYFMHYEPDMLIVTVPFKQYSSKSIEDREGKTTPEAVIEQAMQLIRDRQGHAALLYLYDLLQKHTELNTGEVKLLYDILKMVRYETVYTEQTLLRHTVDYQEMKEHYQKLLEIARWIAADGNSEQYMEEVVAYMHEHQISINALEHLLSVLSTEQ